MPCEGLRVAKFGVGCRMYEGFGSGRPRRASGQQPRRARRAEGNGRAGFLVRSGTARYARGEASRAVAHRIGHVARFHAATLGHDLRTAHGARARPRDASAHRVRRIQGT
eukprot:5544848-Prymnesium_polylepis.1